ncbi:MAG: HAMP domain-containing sensor histidine kinase [Actinomycetota bacterium]
MIISAAGRGTRTSRMASLGSSGIWTLAIGSASVALVLMMSAIPHLARPDLRFHITWPVLALMFGLSESFVVHLQFRRGDAHSFSLNEVVIVMGLFFTEPAGFVLAQLVGAGVALIAFRRQQAIKAVFNLGHLCLEASLAVVVFGALIHGHAPVGPAGWIAALAACAVSATTAGAFVQMAIALSQGVFAVRTAARNVGFALAVAACNTSLGLAAVQMIAHDARSAWLIAMPVIVVYFAYRGYSRQRQKHESLEFLYDSTRRLQKSPTIDDALRVLLEQARTMFRAEMAWITFFGTDDGRPMRTILGPGDRVQVFDPIELDPREGVWARVASEAQPVLLTRPIRSERLRAYFDVFGIRDAIVAPIVGDNGVTGTMLVGNRLGQLGSFDEEDVRLLETLANHASVSLQKVRLVSRLQEALDRMTELHKAKDDFVATVSHELRTPLTSIQGFVQTMLRPDASFQPDEQREFLEVVDRQSRRLRAMIEDLLVVSRIEEHEPGPLPSLVSIQGLSRQVVADLEAKRRGHEVRFRFAEPLALVNTDEEMTYRILSNVIDNAFKYAPEGSLVVVSARSEGAGVRISVADQGDGIPDEMRGRIFDRFFQVDQSHTREFGGAGLGLYICRRLAEALRGRLWLEHSNAAGSVFTLWIPNLSTETGLPSAPADGRVGAEAS